MAHTTANTATATLVNTPFRALRSAAGAHLRRRAKIRQLRHALELSDAHLADAGLTRDEIATDLERLLG